MNDRPSGPTHETSSQERATDWAGVLVLVRRTVSVHVRHGERDQIEDITQEASLRVIRAIRRQPARNVEALATHIAQKACADYVRRRRREAALEKALIASAGHDFPSLRPASGDVLDRLRFVVLEFFGESPCGELAKAFFAGTNWKQYADGAGTEHSAERKKWSRCVEKLRAAARKGGALVAWMDG